MPYFKQVYKVKNNILLNIYSIFFKFFFFLPRILKKFFLSLKEGQQNETFKNLKEYIVEKLKIMKDEKEKRKILISSTENNQNLYIDDINGLIR